MRLVGKPSPVTEIKDLKSAQSKLVLQKPATFFLSLTEVVSKKQMISYLLYNQRAGMPLLVGIVLEDSRIEDDLYKINPSRDEGCRLNRNQQLLIQNSDKSVSNTFNGETKNKRSCNY